MEGDRDGEGCIESVREMDGGRETNREMAEQRRRDKQIEMGAEECMERGRER